MQSLADLLGFAVYDRARERFEESLRIRTEIGDRSRIGNALLNLAEACELAGRLDEAEEYLGRALAIKRKALGPEHPEVAIDLDGTGTTDISTGIPFYDHMLDQLAAHGDFRLDLSCEGDLEIDEHHTVEDCALALGQALNRALGDRRGIGRYGFVLPMDEAVRIRSGESGGRAECRRGLSAERRVAQTGVQPLVCAAASTAALHPRPDRPDGADDRSRRSGAPRPGCAT